jgi:2-polyprenyl-6-methoxyphenol hydroxylase-like FAD-dependent oxidoreductase
MKLSGKTTLVTGSSSLAGESVAIIGGGVAGSTLARLLQLQGVSARVFERTHTRMRVRFSADLVVGADGSGSKVRRVVTPIGYRYMGVTFVEARLTDVDSRHPDVAELVGPGAVLALSDSTGLLGAAHAAERRRQHPRLCRSPDTGELVHRSMRLSSRTISAAAITPT